MPLIGVPLSTYKEELKKIPPGVLPTRTIVNFDERLRPYAEELAWEASRYDPGVFDPAKHCHALPDEFMQSCTFEELAKIWMSHFITLRDREIERRFEKDPEYRIISKLRNSTWRWGWSKNEEEWNNIVDAYNGIRAFSFDIPGFEITLDHTTGYNEYGYGEHDHATYLDGVFGFRVHYQGEHVLTIGFSLASKRRILLAQIQLKKKKGNRFLYALPMGRVEFAVSLFKKYFSGFKLYLIDGARASEKYLEDYRNALERRLKLPGAEEPTGRAAEIIEHLRYNIAALEGDAGERIRNTYRLDRGRYRLSTHRPFDINKLRFNRVVNA